MKGVLRGTEEDNSSVWKKLVVRKIFFLYFSKNRYTEGNSQADRFQKDKKFHTKQN